MHINTPRTDRTAITACTKPGHHPQPQYLMCATNPPGISKQNGEYDIKLNCQD